MASETRRAAQALIDRRVERFDSRHGLAESQARLAAELPRAKMEGRVIFTPEWKTEAGHVVLEGLFAPTAGAQRFLRGASIAMTLLIGACIWALVSPTVESAMRWMLTLTTAFLVLALPFVFVGMGSGREAEEARIRRAIRAALQDEDPKFPPQQRWKDED